MPIDQDNTTRIKPIPFVVARHLPDGSIQLFKRLDTRPDIDLGTEEKLPVEELQKKMTDDLDKSFDRFLKSNDRDNDGKFTFQDFGKEFPNKEIFSRAEFKEMAIKKIAELKLLDKNNDGNISRDEIPKPTELPVPQKQPDPNQLG